MCMNAVELLLLLTYREELCRIRMDPPSMFNLKITIYKKATISRPKQMI